MYSLHPRRGVVPGNKIVAMACNRGFTLGEEYVWANAGKHLYVIEGSIVHLGVSARASVATIFTRIQIRRLKRCEFIPSCNKKRCGIDVESVLLNRPIVLR